PGRPVVWTSAALLAAAFPLLSSVVEILEGRRRAQSWAAFLRAMADDLQTAAARFALQLAFMANEAWARTHAIAITLVRLGVTHRRLLEWETTAASAARGGPVRLRAFVEEMIASPVLALAVGAVLLTRPAALPVAAPILCVWIAAPWIAFALSRPTRRRRAEVSPAD